LFGFHCLIKRIFAPCANLSVGEICKAAAFASNGAHGDDLLRRDGAEDRPRIILEIFIVMMSTSLNRALRCRNPGPLFSLLLQSGYDFWVPQLAKSVRCYPSGRGRIPDLYSLGCIDRQLV